MDKQYKRTLVTCALPYANGPVHIGHLAGVYVPADIYVRYLRLKGEDVLYICGSDEHGVPITIKARQQGCTPQDIVDKYNKIIKDSFSGLGINFDYTSLVYANRILVDLMNAEADLQSAMWQGGDSRLSDIFDECLTAVGKPVAALTKKDRMKIIALLDQKNAFSFRKSVPFVSKRLQVSRYTIYKYLGKLAENGGSADLSE